MVMEILPQSDLGLAGLRGDRCAPRLVSAGCRALHVSRAPASPHAAAWPHDTGPPFGVSTPLRDTSYEVAPLISPPPSVVAENRIFPRRSTSKPNGPPAFEDVVRAGPATPPWSITKVSMV